MSQNCILDPYVSSACSPNAMIVAGHGTARAEQDAVAMDRAVDKCADRGAAGARQWQHTGAHEEDARPRSLSQQPFVDQELHPAHVSHVGIAADLAFDMGD